MLPNNSDLTSLMFRDPQDTFNLPAIAEAKTSFQQAKPYKHLIVDNFLNSDILPLIEASLVDKGHAFETSFTDDLQKNKTISVGDEVPKYLRILAAAYSSPYVLRYLEELTGIRTLISDPYYNTEYGYYHIVGEGGLLGSHLDHSHHQSINIPHVLNIVLFLTPNWDDKNGGALHLFDDEGKISEKRVSCFFNRAIIFSSNPVAFHGVEPVASNAKQSRHSLYFAYYKVSSEVGNSNEVSPYFKADDSDTQIRHGTYFSMNWRTLLRKSNRAHLKTRTSEFAALFLPPIIKLVLRKILSY